MTRIPSHPLTSLCTPLLRLLRKLQHRRTAAGTCDLDPPPELDRKKNTSRLQARLLDIHLSIHIPMHRQSVLRLARQSRGFPHGELPPPYLAPSLHFSLVRTSTQCSSFSSTALSAKDLNKTRGVSAIHRTGPRHKLSVSKYPLPTPVPENEIERRNPTPEHGLWGFFPKDRMALSTPEYDIAHG